MKRRDNNVVLFFSDTHAPYHHRDTLDFLRDVANQYKPDRVIHGGDILDVYSVSSYPKDMNHPHSWTDELKGGRKFVKELGLLFPKLDLLESNHDSRAYSKAVVAGIPRDFLVKYLKVIDAPEEWRLHDRLRVTVDSTREHWLFSHTITGGALSVAKHLSTSVCVGHSHTLFGCHAFNNGKDTFWGVDSGCLISDKGSPYRYNKINAFRPLRGCVVIQDGIPIMVPMGK